MAYGDSRWTQSVVRDSHGAKRRRGYYQAVPESLAQLRQQMSRGRRWLDDPSYAKRKDKKAWRRMQLYPVLYHAAQIRMHNVAVAEWYLEPGDSDSRALVPIFKHLIEKIPNFRQAILALAHGIFEGRSWLKTLFTNQRFRVDGDELVREWEYPAYLGHISADAIKREKIPRTRTDETGDRINDEEYYWTTLEPGVENGTFLRVEKEQEPFYIKFTYHDDQFTYGYGSPLIDALYMPWYNAVTLEENILRYTGKWGDPPVICKIDPNNLVGDDQGIGMEDPETHAANIIATIQKMVAGNIVVVGKDDDVQFITPDGKSVEQMIALKNYYDKQIMDTILGASLQAGAASDVGSNARAQVERATQDDMLMFDILQMEEALQQLVTLLFQANVNTLAEMTDEQGRMLHLMTPPKFRFRKTGSEITPDTVIGAQEAGLAVLRSEAYKAFGLTQPDADDDVVNPPGAGGEIPGEGGPAVDVFGNETLGPADSVPGDGIRMSEGGSRRARFREAVMERLRELKGAA